MRDADINLGGISPQMRLRGSSYRVGADREEGDLSTQGFGKKEMIQQRRGEAWGESLESEISWNEAKKVDIFIRRRSICVKKNPADISRKRRNNN